jgi:hypothetical protein
MPSLFPGIDPFLEGQVWREFHTHLIAEMQVFLAPRLRPKYLVRMEEDLLIEDEPEPLPPPRPDLTIGRRSSSTAVMDRTSAPAQPPFSIPVSLPRPYKQRYLEVRLRSDERVVAVVELLSPTTKAPHTRGRADYLRKRERLFSGPAHVVEVDLLRGGARLPMAKPLPSGDYYVIVSRAQSRPYCDVWPWSLQEPLPQFVLPLISPEECVEVDLQAVYSSVYERVGYEQALHYEFGPIPPLSDEDARWCDERLNAVA